MENLMSSEEFDESIKTDKNFAKKKSNFRKSKPVDAVVDEVEEVKIKQPTKKPRANNLKVMFLGGIGEIGKNMTVLEYGKDIVVIDCGLHDRE